MAYYQSLREYMEALEKAGKLIKITNPINKDTQLSPLVRLQYRGLPEEQRKAFLFTNVVDSRGKKYDIPVLMGSLSFSAIALQCSPQEIPEKLAQAYLHPIKPKLVAKGPVQEVVYTGDRLLEKGGLDEFPVPISTPGLDSGPICSASCWVTKDPETGIRNVGQYRSQLYSPTRMGIHMQGPHQGIMVHWQKCRAKGIPLQVAIVFGGPPNLTYVAPTKFPYGVDEYSVAGAIAGQAVEMVKCKTVDLEVPANADVVIEGEMTTEELEMEGPHGEAHGYEGMEEMQPYLTVKCITHRKDPVWLAQISQMHPSEGGPQAMLYKVFKYDLKMPSVLQIAPFGGVGGTVIIQMKMHADQKEVWRALEEVGHPSKGGSLKYVIAVDDDIDPRSPDKVWWALGTRVEPHRDTRVVKYLVKDLKHEAILPEEEMIRIRQNQFDPNVDLPEASRMLINATLKWPYPPISLPTKKFMEGALAIWRELGLPALKLQEPWYSYELGHWPKESVEDAERAVRGEYYKTSEERARKRVKLPKISEEDLHRYYR